MLAGSSMRIQDAIEEEKFLEFDHSAVAILFSVDEYDQNIDMEVQKLFEEFFNDLRLNETDPVADKILFGSLMR